MRPEGDQHAESPFRAPTPQPGFGARERQALDEHTFIQNTESRLDEFLQQGLDVLENLRDQRVMLNGTRRRLLDAANTLGLSRNVIGWIEQRRCATFRSVRVYSVFILLIQYTRYVHLFRWGHRHVCLLLFHLAISWIIELCDSTTIHNLRKCSSTPPQRSGDRHHGRYSYLAFTIYVHTFFRNSRRL